MTDEVDDDWEYVPMGQIAFYDQRRGDPPEAPRWIWSGPLKKFQGSRSPRGFGGGQPYIFQYLLEDVEDVYVKRRVPKTEQDPE